MPLYEYRCTTCGERTEVLQHLSDPPLKECPKCGGVLERVISAPALQFKGSGWYVTDYAKRAGSGGSNKKDETSGTAKPEGTSAKPESTSAKPEATSTDKGTKKENTTKAS
jgi:putative FmdB family regulatory protein